MMASTEGPKHVGLIDQYPRRGHIYITTLLTDQYNGFVTLKDFELPDDGFD